MNSDIRVDQLVAGFANGDAISSETRLLREQLRAMGYASEIYTDRRHVTRSLNDECRGFQDYAGGPRDVLVYHFSIGSPVTNVFRKTAAKKVMLYHNITPAVFFRGFDDGVAEQLVEARNELKDLALQADAVWADSRFNASEVETVSARNVAVLPLLFAPGPFDGLRDPVVQARFAAPRTTFLFVGRIAPNKRIEDLIQAFSVYQSDFNPCSRLIVVGSERSCPRYYTMLRILVGDLNLLHVCLEGFAAQESLSTYYSLSHAFLCASEHEGYCLPLVEAMHHRVPVVARSIGGVPEAMGEAGVLYEDLSADDLAGLMHCVTADPALRGEILASQARRMQEVTSRDAAAELHGLLQGVVS